MCWNLITDVSQLLMVNSNSFVGVYMWTRGVVWNREHPRSTHWTLLECTKIFHLLWLSLIKVIKAGVWECG